MLFIDLFKKLCYLCITWVSFFCLFSIIVCTLNIRFSIRLWKQSNCHSIVSFPIIRFIVQYSFTLIYRSRVVTNLILAKSDVKSTCNFYLSAFRCCFILWTESYCVYGFIILLACLFYILIFIQLIRLLFLLIGFIKIAHVWFIYWFWLSIVIGVIIRWVYLLSWLLLWSRSSSLLLLLRILWRCLLLSKLLSSHSL